MQFLKHSVFFQYILQQYSKTAQLLDSHYEFTDFYTCRTWPEKGRELHKLLISAT